MAHPQGDSSSTVSGSNLKFRNVGFGGEGKTGVHGERPLGAMTRNQQQTQPIYGAESGNGSWATLVGGELTCDQAEF